MAAYIRCDAGQRRWGLGGVLAALIVAGALAISPSSADAAVTLGSDLQTEPTIDSFCSGGGSDRGCLEVTDVLPGRDLVAPFNGVIVRWSARLGVNTDAQTIRIRVVRQETADTFTVISSGQLESVAAGAGTYTFPAQLPIRSGDQVGVESENGATVDLGAESPGALSYFYGPPIADGESTGPPSFTLPDHEKTFNVDVEPDCDEDGLGDETQDPSVIGGTCPLRGRTVTLDANKNKVKKGKKVTLSGQLTELAKQGECQAAQTVQLQRKRPNQAAFTTVEQLQTNAAGSFSAKEKVKKTFEYRAEVAETATCGAGLSNTEKVKVKKKKKQ
jgi:hypothetical protein